MENHLSSQNYTNRARRKKGSGEVIRVPYTEFRSGQLLDMNLLQSLQNAVPVSSWEFFIPGYGIDIPKFMQTKFTNSTSHTVWMEKRPSQLDNLVTGLIGTERSIVYVEYRLLSIVKLYLKASFNLPATFAINFLFYA